MVAVTIVSSLLTPVTAVGFSTQVARLPKADRLRMGSLHVTVLHAAGLSSMLVMPVLLAAAPGTGFASAGLITVLAGAAVWAVARGRRAVADLAGS